MGGDKSNEKIGDEYFNRCDLSMCWRVVQRCDSISAGVSVGGIGVAVEREIGG